MDEKCALCGEPLEPGSWAQLMFDGTWHCERCIAAAKLERKFPFSVRRDHG